MAEEAAETTMSETEQSESAEQSESDGLEDIKRLNKALAAERKVSKELASKLESLEGQIPTLQKDLIFERRKTIAATKKIPVKLVTGDTIEEMEASADEVLALVAEQAEQAKQQAEQAKPKPAKLTTSTGIGKSGATGTDSRMDGQEKTAAAIRAMRRQ